jgi:protein SCO1/2
MKRPPYHLLLLGFLCVAASLGASSTTATRPAATSGQASCCLTNAGRVGALPDRSLYQLESSWTNDSGQALKLDTLRGRVQVVVMFFANCNYACPLLIHDLQRIEAALPEGTRARVGFTLVTLDSERDTPEALRQFRLGRKLAAERWTLLHGSPADTLELAALLGVKFKREASGQFAHSNLITVLSEQGEIVHQLAGLNQDVGGTVRSILKEIEATPRR